MHAPVALLIPGGLLLAAAAIAPLIDACAGWLALGSRYALLVLLGLAFLFGWRFNRSRLVYGMLLLLLTDRLWAAGAASGGEAAAAVTWLLALLLPLAFLALALSKERGLFTAVGACRLLALVIPTGLVAFLALHEPALVLAQLARADVALPLVGFSLSVPVALALLTGAGGLLWHSLCHRDVLDQGFFWALAAATCALFVTGPAWLPAYYFAVAGLILLVAALESAHGMAFRDELTGLPGRRALNEAMLRLHGRYAVAMLDIDHFKGFNDHYGHDIGDQVLRMVAGRLARVRGNGRAFRYGGEEFTILFPGKAREEALPYLEEVREAVAAARFRLRAAKRPSKRPKSTVGKTRKSGNTVAVTISIGVAGRLPGKEHCQRTMQAADKALYRAKEGGRNRVAT